MTISAKVITHSISPCKKAPPIFSMQLRYPRFIHAELMTHRVFSRNASSSRAIPVNRLIQDIIDDPVYPSFWAKNQSGMQAIEECNDEVIIPDFPDFYPYPDYDCGILWIDNNTTKEDAWDEARLSAIKFAQAFNKAGYHKQIVNRLLEPFSHINVIVTSTDWNNFFGLRIHPHAQQEIRILADAIYNAQQESTPQTLNYGRWHLPYVTDEEISSWNYTEETLIKLSVARCARVSYLTHEGKTPNIDADLALYEKLAVSTPLHASPCEHQATPDIMCDPLDNPPTLESTWIHPEQHGNFTGWIQYRKTLPNEHIKEFNKE